MVRKFVRFLEREENDEEKTCYTEFRSVLDRIKGGDNLSRVARRETDIAIQKMKTPSPRRVKKITSVGKI